jgi:hypothetical protein
MDPAGRRNRLTHVENTNFSRQQEEYYIDPETGELANRAIKLAILKNSG